VDAPADDLSDRERSRTVTRLLRETALDAPQPAEELLPLVYEELRALARARMAKEPAGHTMQATALVHEAYLRLVGDEDPGWNGRHHFFGAAALAMRRILVERARRKGRLKHGGGRQRVTLDDVPVTVEPPADELLAVDEAVGRLEAQDPRKGRIVNLRYFAGLTAEETARVLGVSLGTVEREWRFIKAWLQVELEDQRD
jgi:RNA polymerase sigma factor (TIGR02999 family)